MELFKIYSSQDYSRFVVITFFQVSDYCPFTEERKMFQFEANGASALAARWHNRIYGE